MCGDINPFGTDRALKTNQGKFSTLIRWLLISASLALPLYSIAQLHQNKRLEIPISSDFDSYEIAAAKNYGLVLHRRSTNFKNDLFEIIHTDTAFHEKWRGLLPIDRQFQFAKQITANGNLYLLFFDRNF